MGDVETWLPGSSGVSSGAPSFFRHRGAASSLDNYGKGHAMLSETKTKIADLQRRFEALRGHL